VAVQIFSPAIFGPLASRDGWPHGAVKRRCVARIFAVAVTGSPTHSPACRWRVRGAHFCCDGHRIAHQLASLPVASKLDL